MEIPIGYFPDVKVGFSPPVMSTEFDEVEVERAVSGREQRRGLGPVAGQRTWRATTVPTDGVLVESLETRRAISDFLRARRGQLQAFYFFAPDPVSVFDTALGSVTAASSLIIPWKDGQISDVRVGGVTKAFSKRALSPPPRAYAALRLDGTAAQYVNAGTSSTLRAIGDQSIAVWVYVTDVTGIRSICSNRVANTSGIRFIISAGIPAFNTNFPSSFSGGSANFTLTTGVWRHVAIVKSGASVSFFLDGVKRNTVAGFTNNAVATMPFMIGADPAGTQLFPGMLADLRYYDAAVSDAEVANIYNGRATATTSLKGWWLFTEGTGTSTPDRSGYGNTGAHTGGPQWVGGEDEVVFTAGAQTGVVTGTFVARPRVIVRNMRRSVIENFLDGTAGVHAMFPFEFLELV